MVDKLIQLVRDGFESVTDPRRNNQSYTMPSLLSQAFALFHLKDSSVSTFREQFDVRFENLKQVYGVTALPGDTIFRKSIDKVDPKELQTLFTSLLDFLKDREVLQQR